MNEIAKRLKERAIEESSKDDVSEHDVLLLTEASDDITRLTAEVARLTALIERIKNPKSPPDCVAYSDMCPVCVGYDGLKTEEARLRSALEEILRQSHDTVAIEISRSALDFSVQKGNQ